MSRATVGAQRTAITLDDVLRARARITPYLTATPLRRYPLLDELVGSDIRVLVKHENVQPTGSFKVRNALSALTALSPADRARGVVAATTGNHGQGLAYAGHLLGVRVSLCVPERNNPTKNAAMRSWGARLVEEGRDYDDAGAVAEHVARDSGSVIIHSTNNDAIIAGAGTITVELLEQEPRIDAIIVSIGGGSQAVGAITVTRASSPATVVFGVQAAGAPAVFESWLARERITRPSIDTFAEGIATRNPYDATFDALCDGLSGFVTVTDAELAEAVRLYLLLTHHLAEGAGAASLAGLLKLRDDLVGKTVAIVLSGGNIDLESLRAIVTGAL